MLRREYLVFDNVAPPHDSVSFAIVILDAFTAEVVTDNIQVELLDANNANQTLPFQARRNLSGMWVFVDLPTQPFHRVKITAGNAGYFDPGIIDFIPPAPNDPDVINKRRLEVFLYRRPELAAKLQATVVAGLVQRAGQAVAGAQISAMLPVALIPPAQLPLQDFITLSDERGAFALPLRLPGDAALAPVSVTFTLSEGADQRQFVRDVEEQFFYSFEQPIDLQGNAITNDPPLKKFGN
ncbi:MAG: hypothetical protein V3T17_02310 [Pseudomonadales bacterium]